jgi:hypothetical protein
VIVDKINRYLSTAGKKLDDALLESVAEQTKYIFQRQFGEQAEFSTHIGLSAVGKCIRQNVYRKLGFSVNGKTIDSRAKMVFFQGDAAELAVIFLAQLAGCKITNTGKNQKTVKLLGLEGHPDGILEYEGVRYLLEVKSMSSFAFKRFQKKNIDESYLFQVSAYMLAENLRLCVFVALNKDSGVLAEQIIPIDSSITEKLQSRIAVLESSGADNLPARPYGPDKNGFLPWQCLYCPFWKHCWPEAQKVLVEDAYKLKFKAEEKEVYHGTRT